MAFASWALMFFFSSRRRHTISKRDWSSDVCSSDLAFSFTLLRKKFYFDEFYQALINSTQEFLARIAAFIDRWVIDATAVRGSSGATWSFGALLRLMQVGNLQAYAFIFGLGIVWIIYFALFR